MLAREHPNVANKDKGTAKSRALKRATKGRTVTHPRHSHHFIFFLFFLTQIIKNNNKIWNKSNKYVMKLEDFSHSSPVLQFLE